MGHNKTSRAGFYIVVLFMFFISVSLLIYADEQSVFNNEVDGVDSLDYEGFIAIEISDVSPGTQALMRSFLPVTNVAYADPIEDDKTSEIPYVLEMEALLLSDDSFSYGSIVLNTLDDGTTLPNDITISDLELPDDDLILAERTDVWKEYVVQQKETLSDIVMRFGGITVHDVVRANELKDPDRLKEKQILLIPLKEEFVEDTLEEVRIRKARVVALKEAVVPLMVSQYTVQDGDSLWSIANSLNLEVDTLIGSNTLGDILRPNVVLRVPNQDGIFHKFKKGDTVEKVAAAYKVQIDRIKKVNPNTDLDSIKAGSELFIPGARIEAAEPKRDNRQQSSKAGKNVSGGSSGGFRWPVQGKITSPYGWRRHPILRRADFHSALDIKARKGTPIKASRAGKVAYSGWMSGYGKVVVIDHPGGFSTLYGHCSSLGVRKGQNVAANEVIARVGATGRATGPHVHFEIRSRNKPVNPLKHLK